jgi:uncharacterized protein YecE (DUF72 family)
MGGRRRGRGRGGRPDPRQTRANTTLSKIPQFDLFGAPDPDIVKPARANSLADSAQSVPARIRVGTSSWSFPGWNGIVYDGEYSERALARNGLAAYAQHPLLRTVGIDRSYYAPLQAREYEEYARVVPDDFRFLVKAERLLTLPDITDSSGSSAVNARFLDAAYATEMVVAPIVDGLQAKAGPILFQFSPMHPRRVGGVDAFAERLHEFIDGLPRGPLYAVELRTPELFTRRYVDALHSVDAVHAFTVHGSMTPLAEQLHHVPAASQRALVIRWMLHAKFGYSEARAAYAPFNQIVDRDDETRDAIVAAAIEAAEERREAYVVINNKAEGSSPLSAFETMKSIAEEVRTRRV